jgi:hypothetical protein
MARDVIEMRRILIAVGLWLAFCASAFAQSAIVVLPGGCGTGAFANASGYFTMDSTGHLCISGVTSGGSITPTAPSGSLTLTAGGTSQQLFAANEVVHGCTIQNPSTATEAIFVDFTGAAAVQTAGGTSIQVPAGASIPCGAGIAKSVNWIAATISHQINAVKF